MAHREREREILFGAELGRAGQLEEMAPNGQVSRFASRHELGLRANGGQPKAAYLLRGLMIVLVKNGSAANEMRRPFDVGCEHLIITIISRPAERGREGRPVANGRNRGENARVWPILS